MSLIKNCIILILPVFLIGKPLFKDSQLLAMTPNYFSRDHSSPTLLGANIYKTNKGRVFRLDIEADRNRFDEDLIFAFSALSNMAAYNIPRMEKQLSPFQRNIMYQDHITFFKETV